MEFNCGSKLAFGIKIQQLYRELPQFSHQNPDYPKKIKSKWTPSHKANFFKNFKYKSWVFYNFMIN